MSAFKKHGGWVDIDSPFLLLHNETEEGDPQAWDERDKRSWQSDLLGFLLLLLKLLIRDVNVLMKGLVVVINGGLVRTIEVRGKVTFCGGGLRTSSP
jgi:hypothetical protein